MMMITQNNIVILARRLRSGLLLILVMAMLVVTFADEPDDKYEVEWLCFQRHNTDSRSDLIADNYNIERLFREINIIDSRTVALHLNREALFPESRLRIPLTRSQSIAFMGASSHDTDVPDDQRDWNGPYLLKRFVTVHGVKW